MKNITVIELLNTLRIKHEEHKKQIKDLQEELDVARSLLDEYNENVFYYHDEIAGSWLDIFKRAKTYKEKYRYGTII